MPLHVIVFYGLLAGAALLALAIGGRPEKEVAAMLVVATLASKFVAWHPLAHFGHFEPALFAIDLLLLIGLGRVALCSDRYWPIWLTSLHGYSLIAHLSRALIADTHLTVYLTNTALTADPQLVILMVASWRHWRRQRQGNVLED